MRLVATMVLVGVGALLVCVGEITHTFSPTYRSDAGYLAAGTGVFLTAIGLVLMVVELDPLPIRWLRELVSGRGRTDDEAIRPPAN